jgi:magnesium transporter
MDESTTVSRRASSENSNNPVDLAQHLAGERPADIVDVLDDQPPNTAAAILQNLPEETAVAVLDQPGLSIVAEVIAAMPRDRAAKLLSGMSADRVTDVFRELTEPARADLLERLDPGMKRALEILLAYPENTVGSIMTTEYVWVPATATIAEVLQHIREVESTHETVYAIYVLDPTTHALVHAVPLRRLVTGDPNANVLTAITARQPITVSALASRDDAARLISRYDLLAIAVVDDANHMLGIVTVDDVIDVMVQRQNEEVQRFGGMESLDEPYMDISFWAMIRKRAGWLCVLFLSEMLTASAMQGFEGELEKAIVLTLFIPLIMSSGGNSGSQATSLLIRALALKEIRLGDWWRVALRELPMGITLGAILGVIGALRITLWQKFGFYDYGEHWVLIAVTVGAALVGIVTFGSMSGSMLPFVLQRVGFDPATASAPFVATLVDVSGLVIYFSVAMLILKGTLL